MAVLKCCECSRYFHRNNKKRVCIFCGDSNVQEIDYKESNNKEALMYYKKGEEYLRNKKYNNALEQFYMALRFDCECSEAYWMGYLAMNELNQDDELLYSGKIDKNSSEIRNALKYADEITNLVYKEILRIDSFYEGKLKENNKKEIDIQIRNIVRNSNCDTFFEAVNDISKKIKEEQVQLNRSMHKQVNLEWKVKQKYANIEFAQLKLCKNLIDIYSDKGYEKVASEAADIITLSAIEKYQESVNVAEVENLCKNNEENKELQQEIINQTKIRASIKSYQEHMQQLKMLLQVKFKEVENVEKNVCTNLAYDKKQLYACVDKNSSIMENYMLLKKEAE